MSLEFQSVAQVVRWLTLVQSPWFKIWLRPWKWMAVASCKLKAWKQWWETQICGVKVSWKGFFFGGGMWKMKGDICWGSKSVSPLVPLWCSVLHEEHQFLYLSRRIVGLPFLMQGDSELLRPLAWTCPESCGCTSPEAAANPPAYCPRSCFAWNIHQNQRNQDSKRYDCLCWDWLNGWETGATFWSIMIRHLCPLNICDLIVKR